MAAVMHNRSEPAETRANAVRASDASIGTFRSILFDQSDARNLVLEGPSFFGDLNLDQTVHALTTGREEHNLKPFFYTSLRDVATIAYRHAIFQDLEDAIVFQSIKLFSSQMQEMRQHLAFAERLSYNYEKEGWFLDAVETYCGATEELLNNLRRCNLTSRGLLTFLGHLTEYVDSSSFRRLVEETKKLRSELSAVKYCLLINGNRVTVRHDESEIDYSAVVEETFAKFQQSAVKDYRVRFRTLSEMNQIETSVLELVARLNPEVFSALDDYWQRNRACFAEAMIEFDREIQFYIAWLEYTEGFKAAGLRFCYPRISDTCKEIASREGFDLALAGKLLCENLAVVCNDFHLRGEERIIVVTGPNQGGKTTFARTFGQLHYLASLGCPVPGSEARLFLFDHLFTHFEREEDITTLRGKLQNDLETIHRVLSQVTPDSIIIMNEIFSSTTLKDSAFLSKKILETVSELDVLCVCVTFLDELAALNEKVVSIIPEILADNPTLRTYKLERKAADGLAYAVAIAEKYQLTYERLKERVKRS